MLGTMLGFATISSDRFGIGLAQETRGVAAASSAPDAVKPDEDDTNAEKAGKNVIRRLLASITYQRTVTTVSPDPALLLQRPWLARHEAAAERTPQEAQPVQSTGRTQGGADSE